MNRRRASLPLQLQQTIVGQQVNLNMTIVMCGITKVFVGELIEAGAGVTRVLAHLSSAGIPSFVMHSGRPMHGAAAYCNSLHVSAQ